MQLIKGKYYNLREIFSNAVNEGRKGVKIMYIWINECDKCGNEIPVLDEEYSFEYITENNTLYTTELVNAYKDFQEDYGIWDKKYEDNVESFIYIGFDENSETDVYYYYYKENEKREYCHICEEVFRCGGKK